MNKKILFIIGSFRENSFHGTIAENVKQLIGNRAEVKVLNYKNIPLYNQDLEANGGVSEVNELRKYVDTLIVIPNDRLKNYNAEGMKARNVFHAPNDVLYRAVKGIVDIITKEGMINIDFADVKTVMENAGDAVIGLGEAKEGEDVILAVKYAVENPLLDRSLKGAKKALINITLPADAEFIEFEEIVDEVIKFSENDDLDVMLGVMFDETSTDTKVTVVATGFEDDVKPLSNVVSNREYVKPEENINNNPEYTVTLPTLD